MKKVFEGGILVVLAVCLLSMNVEAKNVYYTNNLGVEMTQLEYNKMTQIFSERRVSDVTAEEFELYKDANIVSSDVVYEKTIYDLDGNILAKEAITEAEYNNASEAEVSEGSIMPYGGDNKYVETTYKRLAGTLADFGSGRFQIVGSLSWKKVPVCRSYDIFAYRFNHFDYNNFAGTQLYYFNGTSSRIAYDTSSPGYKAQATGAGVSMNLVDGSNITGYELSVVTNLTKNSTTATQGHAYIAYEHAQSNLTREQSMGYTLSISGMGNVILFNSSSIAAKYDNMAGVHLIGAF